MALSTRQLSSSVKLANLFLFGLLSATGLAQCVPDISSNLIARWDLSNDAVDLSGNGHDGTLVGPPVSVDDRCGNPDEAFYFNGVGTNQYIWVPNSSDLNLSGTDYSISAWIKSDTAASNGVILAKRNGYGLTNGWIFFVDPNEKIGYAIAGGNGGFQLRSIVPIDTLKWHHLVLSYKSNSDSITLYVDNVVDTVMANVPSPTATPSQLRIGNDPQGQTYEFSGRIDDIRLYHRALTACDVDSLYYTLCDLTAGIESQSPAGSLLSVFPNPSSGEVWIELNETHYRSQIRVLDVAGKVIHERTVLSNTSKFDLQLESGVYVLQVTHGGRVQAERLIVQ